MYGYEVKKRLDERLGHTWKFSYGSLYPTLKKLSKVEAVELEFPDGETLTRKKKIVYRITPKGEAVFEALLDESGASATEDREAFMLRLAFFRYTKPETRRRLLERRRGYLQDRLAKMKESLKTLRERVDAYSVAFDVDAKKVGYDLSEALVAEPNNTIKFADIPPLGVEVLRGPTLDGLGRYYREMITESPAPTVDVVAALRESKTDVLVSYLPVGSEAAARFYAEAALQAGVAFANCMPVFIASTPEWAQRFREAGVPIIGDDIKSQVGSTIIHRTLAKLFADRAVQIERTYQLNFGGNMDFMNMLERERLLSKKISKTQAVTSNITQDMHKENIHVGPSDHVPWLEDRKWAHIRIEGKAFGEVPLVAELKLEVWDSPNSAGIVIDAVQIGRASCRERV